MESEIKWGIKRKMKAELEEEEENIETHKKDDWQEKK